MTIQEMFNLLRDYRDAVCKEHNAAIMGAKDLVQTMIHTQHIANEVFLYLPQFTRCHVSTVNIPDATGREIEEFVANTKLNH